MLAVTLIDKVEVHSETIHLQEEFFSKVVRRWDNDDPLLLSMQRQPFLKGCRRLRDLKIKQYRVLIALHMTVIATGSEYDQSLAVISRDELIASLVLHLEMATDSRLSELRITRHTPEDLEYDFSAKFGAMPFPAAKSLFKVVVDNTV